MAHVNDFDVTDYVFKIIVIGDSGVGKSSLVRKYITGDITYYPTTICVSFYTKTVYIGRKEVKLQIWDTSGEERWTNILVKSYYRNADGVIFVFDISKPQTLENITSSWMKNVELSCPDDCMKVLVGNKRDLSKGEGVESAIETTCDLYCLPYLETSAKLDSNLDKVFLNLAEKLILQRDDYDSLRVPDSLPSFALHSFQPHSPITGDNNNEQCSSCGY